MNNNTNTQIIAHDQVLLLVQEADQLVEAHQEHTGELSSSAGILLTCVSMAADNVPDFTSVRLVIDYRGYAIEFDSTVQTAFDVLANLRRAMGVLEEMMEDDSTEV